MPADYAAPAPEDLTSIHWAQAVQQGGGVFAWAHDGLRMNGWIALGRGKVMHTHWAAHGDPQCRGDPPRWALRSDKADETLLTTHFGGVDHDLLLDPKLHFFTVVAKRDTRKGATMGPVETIGFPGSEAMARDFLTWRRNNKGSVSRKGGKRMRLRRVR